MLVIGFFLYSENLSKGTTNFLRIDGLTLFMKDSISLKFECKLYGTI
jgi:hypothetical protein